MGKKNKLLQRIINESIYAGQPLNEPPMNAYNGCIMLEVEDSEIKKLRKMIAKEDLYENIKEGAHATLLYGINTEMHPVRQLRSFINRLQLPENLTLGGLSVWENGTFDVLKLEVLTGQSELSAANVVLRHGLIFENPRIFYQPHVTVAYLKPGKGWEYVDKLGYQMFTTPTTKVTYSIGGGSNGKTIL